MSGHGGYRENSGRKELPPGKKKVLRSIVVTPTLDAWIQSQRQDDEKYGQTVERLLRGAYDIEDKQP